MDVQLISSYAAFSETNAKTLIAKGFDVKDEISAAVKGSEKSAYHIINKISEFDLKIGVHYCSSSFKDASQLRNRILRRARSIAKDFEVITKEGTILKGVIYSKNMSLRCSSSRSNSLNSMVIIPLLSG